MFVLSHCPTDSLLIHRRIVWLFPPKCTSIVRSEKERCFGNIFGIADTPQWIPLGQAVKNEQIFVYARLPDRCSNRAGADHIGAHIVLTIFQRHILGQIDHARLGGAVALFTQPRQAINKGKNRLDSLKILVYSYLYLNTCSCMET